MLGVKWTLWIGSRLVASWRTLTWPRGGFVSWIAAALKNMRERNVVVDQVKQQICKLHHNSKELRHPRAKDIYHVELAIKLAELPGAACASPKLRVMAAYDCTRRRCQLLAAPQVEDPGLAHAHAAAHVRALPCIPGLPGHRRSR